MLLAILLKCVALFQPLDVSYTIKETFKSIGQIKLDSVPFKNYDYSKRHENGQLKVHKVSKQQTITLPLTYIRTGTQGMFL